MLELQLVKKILSNGLIVLVFQNNQIPKVSTQLWYNVGSKHEQSGERGLAHLIEHMIFKGTAEMSESDINLITQKLSGHCNAFTSYDYTGYLFDFPTQNWREALPIMADCMQNCQFREDLLNSELKAVIQELKMYNDDYDSLLVERMMGAVFADHPYHYPVIGFKQDLWSLKREALVAFYKKHYLPNNATLVVVGDVDPEEVFSLAEKSLGAIPAGQSLTNQEFYHKLDIEGISVVLRRDVKQPTLMLGWTVPGAREKRDYALDAISWIMGLGKGSRLYRVLVEELGLATDVESFVYDLFDHGMFFVRVEITDTENVDQIITLIHQQVQNIALHGPTEQEVERAVRKIEMDFVSLSENNQKFAYLLGKYFVATGDENYILNYCKYPRQKLAKDIKEIMATYVRPHLMHIGKVLPLQDEDKKYWLELQKRSDAEDARILGRIVRDTEIEGPRVAQKIKPHDPKPFAYPHAQEFTLSNGIRVFCFNNPRLPKVDIFLDLKARHWHDLEGKDGMLMFVADMLQEGTTRYSSQELAQELESLGMALSTFPGQVSMSMLSQDIKRGLSLMAHVLMDSSFEEESVERVRAQLLVDLANYWDNPSQFVGQIAKEIIYKGHPYAKHLQGTRESISSLTRDELFKSYKDFISPNGARLAIVGNLDGVDVKKLLEETLGAWQGPVIKDVEYPMLSKPFSAQFNYPINRDQVVLCYAGLSVDRMSPDYDKLLLFDQIFSGGVLGSMSSRLFDLREQSGLFYTIGGSLIARADKQPGMIFVKTIVSNDRLAEAEKAIEDTINTAIDTITQEELEEAKRAVINSLVDHFGTNKDIAASFLSLDYFGFKEDYFDKRPAQLASITVEQVKDAVKRWLSSNNLVKICVGRV